MVKVTWEYYKRRRNVNFEAFLKGRNIETYEQLCETLHKMGIMAPKKEEFEEARSKIEESKPPLDVIETGTSETILDLTLFSIKFLI